MMKVLLFGSGDCYQKYKKWFDGMDVAGILDNDESRRGMVLDGRKVMLPSEGVRKEYDCIYILSVHEKEMKSQLLDLGVEENKIYHYFDIGKHLHPAQKPLEIYGDAFGKKAVLALFYDLDFNGASLALFGMVKAVKSRGIPAAAASMNDGGLKKALLELGVVVVIDSNMQVNTFQNIQWAQHFGLVICNTVNYYRMLSRRDTSIRFIWWLHEPELFYEGIEKKLFLEIDEKNLDVYAAGQAAAEAFHKLRPEIAVKTLFYGLPDCAMPIGSRRHYGDGRILFAVIGNLQPYKAQDVYIKAVLQLDPAVRRQAVFFIVGGHGHSCYAEKLRCMADEVEEIRFLGNLPHEEVHALMEEIDVLVCPSRQDTMPTVAAEAMMHRTACILSDSVGTAPFIINGEDGIVFACDHADKLAEEMAKCINGQYDIKKMGLNARHIYEQFFSMNAFQKNVDKEILFWHKS